MQLTDLILFEATLVMRPKERMGRGFNQSAYPVGKDRVAKVPLGNSKFNSDHYLIMQRHPELFSAVYRLTDDYAIVERLDVGKAQAEFEKMMHDVDPDSWLFEERMDYDDLLRMFFFDENLFETEVGWSGSVDKQAYKRWLNLFGLIKDIVGEDDMDLHLGQIGYDSKGNLKLVDY